MATQTVTLAENKNNNNNTAAVKETTKTTLVNAGNAVLNKATNVANNNNNGNKNNNNNQNKNNQNKNKENKKKMLMERLEKIGKLSAQREQEGVTLTHVKINNNNQENKNNKSGPKGLARHYRVAGGYVLTRWARNPNDNNKFVRNGEECWYDSQDRCVRRRFFCNGVQVGNEKIFCYGNNNNGNGNNNCLLVYNCNRNNQGQKIGQERRYEVNPNASSAANNQNGQNKNGLVTVHTIEYNQNGQREGVERRELVRNCRPLVEIWWRNNLRNGLAVAYFKNGRVAASCNYINGNKHGRSIENTRSGKTFRTINWICGEKRGEKSFP